MVYCYRKGITEKRMKKFLSFILDGFNIKREAEDLGVPIWQTPSILFIFMGLITVAAMTGVYYVSRSNDYPEIIVISESIVVIVIFTIGNFIIKNIEEIARTNKMKTEFVSIASHQLKTPLSEINWELELLMKRHQEGLNEKQLEILDGIGRSNAKMTRLVNDLLDVARIDQGRLALVKEWVDMASLVKDVISNNLVIAQAAGIQLSADADLELPRIAADKRRISVVLDNLISNSIKYVENEGVVKVRVGKEGDNIVVEVSDNGVGIPLHQQEKVFQKFFRSDNVVKNQTDGTGLGLYIAKNIVEQSGGKMWFESKEGKGTSFWFSLPCLQCEAV